VRRTGVNTTRRQRLRQTALVRPSPRAATAAVAARRISCCYCLSLSLSCSCSCRRCYRRSSCSAPQLLRLPQLLALLLLLLLPQPQLLAPLPPQELEKCATRAHRPEGTVRKASPAGGPHPTLAATDTITLKSYKSSDKYCAHKLRRPAPALARRLSLRFRNPARLSNRSSSGRRNIVGRAHKAQHFRSC
jgi:hypothetical protein